jgi:hypothetical protein
MTISKHYDVIKSMKSTSFTADFLVNPSHAPENGRTKTTTGISGQNFRGWSPKLDLVGLWLRTYLESSILPGTRFVRIWSGRATPSGFFVMKLRLSEPRTGERESSLWRTPKADDPNHGSVSCEAVWKKLEKRQTIRLQDQVDHPALFRTPDAGCGRGAQSKERFAESLEKHRPLTLNDQVAHLLSGQIHLFPTPRAADGVKGQRTKEGVGKEANQGHGIDLPTYTQLYPTATVHGNDNKKGSSARSGNGLATFVKQRIMPAGGALNPAWVEWLMGFPAGWTEPGGDANPTSPESSPGESHIACRV